MDCGDLLAHPVPSNAHLEHVERKRGRLEERTTLVADLPWKDYFFIHPTRAAALPDGVFKARMAG